MKVRYKITLGFMLLTVFVLTALCFFVYYYTAVQHTKDFEKRLRNRAATVASILFKLPLNDYQLLSQLDSATSNLLVSENINVYNTRNQLIYRFARSYADTVATDAAFLNDVRIKGYVSTKEKNRQIVAVYFDKAELPVVVMISAIDENGLDNLKELRQSLFIAFICGILLSWLSGWVFSKRILYPVAHITALVNDISATSIENRLAVSHTKDEWQELTATFNNLLSRLQKSFEIQGRFISNASHELSTPLTSVSNQIDVILQKPRTNEEYHAVLQSVKADIRHMSALTQQLLSLASTARGGAIQTEALRIDEIIMELPMLIKKMDPAYIVNIFFEEFPEDEKRCTVNGSYELLLSACKNVAENGCKYAPDKTVNITLSFIQDQMLVLFSNKVAGSVSGNLDNIFQPFQRGDNVSDKYGYGLGLSLTRRIILLHKGEIKAEVQADGIFLITIMLPATG